VIPYGKRHSIAVPWNTSMNGYTVRLPFTLNYSLQQSLALWTCQANIVILFSHIRYVHAMLDWSFA